DTEALLTLLGRLKAAGNSVFVVEHRLDVVRGAQLIANAQGCTSVEVLCSPFHALLLDGMGASALANLVLLDPVEPSQ
ncbi:hypothetical protein, partial [Streptomyces minutiscleroticus]|uniref:hypothetical protein n=1 Tax=Streptomyces minutiscleroticus TaxID=68238 RepID=UPI00332FABDA